MSSRAPEAGAAHEGAGHQRAANERAVREPAWRAFVRPDAHVPLTERLLPRAGWARVVAVGLLACLPFVHLVAFWALGRLTGITSAPAESLVGAIGTRLLNSYLIVLTIWAAGSIAAQLRVVRDLTPGDRGPAADWRAWFVPAVVIALVFAALNEVSHVDEFGMDVVRASPSAFATSFGLAVLIRIPQAVALWTIVVALAAVARIHTLPMPYPEDRSLGLRPVGVLLTVILLLLAMALVPSFLFGTSRLADLLMVAAVFAVGVSAMLLAVWRIHERMATARDREVTAARARFATAYRALQANPTDPDAAGLPGAKALLDGAESIYEWPFDERLQRIAAIIVTGVLTGLIVRVVLLALGI